MSLESTVETPFVNVLFGIMALGIGLHQDKPGEIHVMCNISGSGECDKRHTVLSQVVVKIKKINHSFERQCFIYYRNIGDSATAFCLTDKGRAVLNQEHSSLEMEHVLVEVCPSIE